MPVSAKVFSIVRGSLQDGPGVRSVVYFVGCPLRCQWCHNPECFPEANPITVMQDKCIGCGRCMKICPEHHLKDIRTYVPQGCTGCGRCADSCPSGALKRTSWELPVDRLMNILLKDAHFYRQTGGGITLSGGECLLYRDAVSEIGRVCRQEGIHLLAETSACVDQSNILAAAEWIDTFYIDVKHMDPEKHRIYTGRDNLRILCNIRLLAERSADILLRTPLILGVNDDWDNLLATARFAKSLGASVRGLCLLKYNPLGTGKYAHLGLKAVPFGDETQTDGMMAEIGAKLNAALGETAFVYIENGAAPTRGK